jgi:hypothetical protein
MGKNGIHICTVKKTKRYLLAKEFNSMCHSSHVLPPKSREAFTATFHIHASSSQYFDRVEPVCIILLHELFSFAEHTQCTD